MGVATAPQIADKLMADGLTPDMPIAVIENATRRDMRVLRGMLAGLPELVEAENVRSPALIVIGEVAASTDRVLDTAAMEAAPCSCSPAPLQSEERSNGGPAAHGRCLTTNP